MRTNSVTKSSFLGDLFRPKSIAVVGASQDHTKGGHRPLRFLLQHGYRGKIFPINPKYATIDGLTCYPSLTSIPEPVDTVMITVPEYQVVDVLKDCRTKKVRLAIIRSAFNLKGKLREKETAASLHSIIDCGLRIMGPSSLGFVNVPERISAYFHVSLSMKELNPGPIGFVSQSGGLSGVIFNKIQDRGLGFSHVFSTGIETDLEAADYMEFLIEDPATRVISCFIEGFKDPKRVLEIYHKAAKAQKPIIMMKLGRSALGMAAAQSHTGKMVGMDDLWNAVFTQKGVVRVETLDELVETSILFAKARRPQGPGIGIFASSGGGASISTDQAGLHGLELAELSGQTLAELKNVLPDYASIGNPLDGGPLGEKRYTRCLELFAKDSNINILLLPLTIVPDGFGVERARRLVEWNKSLNKPLVVLWLGGSLVGQAIRIVERSDIPIFRSEDRCIKALKAFSEYYRWEKEFSTCPIQSTISEADQGAFDQFACARGLAFDDPTSQKAILEHFGIPKPREGVARSLDEAFRVAQEIGYPVALKLLSPQIIHKTESGAVEIGIQDEAGLEKAHSALLEAVKGRNPEAEIKGILVQEMIRDGAEFLVGMYQDPELGPVVTCGLGGIFVEILKDIALRIPPFDNSIARSMVQELKGHGVLKGFRGLRKLDSNALIDAITRFSRMCIFLKDRVAEMEINPLMVLEEGKGVRAVDCRFIEKHAQDCEK